MSSLGDDQRNRLRAAQLEALVRGVGGDVDDAVRGFFPDGATLEVGGDVWVLDDEAGERSLGPALTWAVHRGARSLGLVGACDNVTAGALARRATYFSLPITVWVIDGTSMRTCDPAPPSTESMWDTTRAATLVEVMSAAGLDVVEEDGVIKGEFEGLEVARVVDGDPDPRVEIGIGRFDREAGAMMHSGEPTATTLERAVDIVRRYRVRGAPPHPLRDLMAARWIRSGLLDDPSSVGARDLVAIPTTVPVENLKAASPAAAFGHDADGEELVVVCSAGSDLDLVPVAADTRAVRAPGSRLLLAVPARHVTSTQQRVIDTLVEPADLITVDAPF